VCTIRISEIDESLALGFYCKDYSDFEQLATDIGEVKQTCESLIWFEDNKPEQVALKSDSGDDFSMDDF
jgi:hypothetical protein